MFEITVIIILLLILAAIVLGGCALAEVAYILRGRWKS